MLEKPNFYSVIIGTELLNGRRIDAHFAFLNQQLLSRSWEHKASFVIADDTQLMLNIFNLIKSDPNSVMFCLLTVNSEPVKNVAIAAPNRKVPSNPLINRKLR